MITRTQCFMFGIVCIVTTMLTHATEPIVYDQNNIALIGVPELVTIDEILAAYDATADESDPELPPFLEGVLDLVSPEIRSGGFVAVLDIGIKSTFDENNDLVEQGLDCAVFIGTTEAEISLLTLSGGELRVHVTLCPNGEPPAYHDATYDFTSQNRLSWLEYQSSRCPEPANAATIQPLAARKQCARTVTPVQV